MHRAHQHHEKPPLYLDVDGVISVFGFPDADAAPGPFLEIDGDVHCIPAAAGQMLERLARSFELVWATGWEHRANQHLLEPLDVAFEPLPTLTFDGRAVFGSAHWKMDAITAHSAGRPLAWVDDNLDDSCRLWALSREAPTLLVDTKASVGLTRQHVHRLEEWARSLDASLPAGRHVA